jgi:drug/metabolite transporter (DMT)-like permease
MPPQKQKIFLILMIGLTAYSSGAIFIRLAMATEGIQNPSFTLFLAASRLAIASCFLLPTWRSLPQAKYSFKHLRYSLMAGICLAGFLASWMMSLGYTSITASTTLSNTHPIWVVLLSWLWFKDKPNRLALLGTGFALAGSLIIGLTTPANSVQHHIPVLGNSLALMSACSNGLYVLLGHRAQCSGIPLRHHTALVFGIATLILLPMPLLVGGSYMGYAPMTYVYVVFLALIPQLIGHTCFNWAMRWIKPHLLTLVILGEPVIASFLGYLTFQEFQGIGIVMGAIILVCGVAITALSPARPHYSRGSQTKKISMSSHAGKNSLCRECLEINRQSPRANRQRP